MLKTFLEAFIEMHPNWGIDREPEMVEPARRHRCEICKLVFECHLCHIGYTHEIHTDHPKTLPETLMFVCEDCCTDLDKRFQLRRSDGKTAHQYYTDMFTGEAKIPVERIRCRLKSNRVIPGPSKSLRTL